MKWVMKWINYITLSVILLTGMWAGENFCRKEYVSAAIFVGFGIINIILANILIPTNNQIRIHFDKQRVLLKGEYEVKKNDCSKLVVPVYIKTRTGKEIQLPCLIDTGFTDWLQVDESIQQQLGLEKKGTMDCISVNSHFTANFYYGCVRIGALQFENIPICAHKFPEKGEKGIIGMKIIQHGKLLIENHSYLFKI